MAVSEKKDNKLLCPRCLDLGKKIRMNKIKKYNITIDKCPKCEGLWLDKNEINIIIKKLNEGDKK